MNEGERPMLRSSILSSPFVRCWTAGWPWGQRTSSACPFCIALTEVWQDRILVNTGLTKISLTKKCLKGWHWVYLVRLLYSPLLEMGLAIREGGGLMSQEKVINVCKFCIKRSYFTGACMAMLESAHWYQKDSVEAWEHGNWPGSAIASI